MDNLLEIMRVLRKPPMGKLVVGIGEEHYTQLDEIKNPKTRQRILAAVGELVSFAGGYQVLEDSGLAPPSKALGSQRPTAEDEELTPAQAKFLESLKAAPVENEPLASQSRMRNLLDLRPPPAPEIKAEETPAEPRSIAEQIDVILQELIAQDPEMSQRHIRLETASGGGLQIAVDSETYQRPGQIPDKKVQDLIKVALKQWEAN